MAVPWSRRSPTSQPRRQDTPDRRFQQRERRGQHSRLQVERRRQRLAIIVGVVVVLAILAVPAYGYYNSFIAPPRVWAVRVNDTTLTMGDLVKRIRVLQGLNRYSGQNIDLGRVPFDELFGMLEDELVRQGAPTYEIALGEADVEQKLRERFYPMVPEGEGTSPGQLEQEFAERYRDFLNTTQLSDKDYRSLVEVQLYRSRLREELINQIPSVAEQVEVQWIELPQDQDPATFDPNEVHDRLEKGEDFAQVAQQVSVDRLFSDENGYVGWVPRNAFPGLDKTLFGTDDNAPIPNNQLSDILLARNGLFILKVVGGPEEREISNIMRQQIESSSLRLWLDEQHVTGADAGWVDINFSSDLLNWVIKQVRASATRTLPTPTR